MNEFCISLFFSFKLQIQKSVKSWSIRSNKKNYSCDEIKYERRQGLTENNYRFYPCYKLINDKTTLQWWLIHY